MKFKGFNLTVTWEKGSRQLHLDDLLLEEGTMTEFDGLCSRVGVASSVCRAVDIVITDLEGNHRFDATAGRGIVGSSWDGVVHNWCREEQDMQRLGPGIEDVVVGFGVELTPDNWEALEALRGVCDVREDSDEYVPCLLVELTAVDE